MKKNDSSGQKKNEMDAREALKRAAALCGKQEQCTSHIRDKLKSWSVPEKEIENILNVLQKEKFIDDSRYARFFVKDKFKFNRWGKIKISYMLRQKGIPELDISEAIGQINEDDYFRTCADLIRNKSLSVKDKNQFTRKSKLYRFAAGRGFEPDLIHRILNNPG